MFTPVDTQTHKGLDDRAPEVDGHCGLAVLKQEHADAADDQNPELR